MHSTTTFDSASIAHSLRRHYAGDYDQNSGSKTRNRFVNPTEYEKVDALQSPAQQTQLSQVHVPMGQPSQTQRALLLGQPSQSPEPTLTLRTQATPLSTDTRSNGDNIEVEDESDDDREEDFDEDDLDLSNTTHMELWLKMLTECSETDDESNGDLYEGDEVNTLLVSMRSDDECEVAASPLPPLPMENDPKYPQEDATYFKDKKYVRKDKYKLLDLISFLKEEDGYELPSIMSAYGKKAQKW